MNLNKNPLPNKFFYLALFFSFFPHTTFGIFNYSGSQLSLIFPLFFFHFFFLIFVNLNFIFLY